jgi:hypothetical protein
MTMKEVVIVGTGNVAFHFISNFINIGYSVSVYGRNTNDLSLLKSEFNIDILKSINEIKPNSIVILAIPDKNIESLLNVITIDVKVIYTSGSVQLNTFPKRANLGVLYPLQTLTKNRKINFKEVPILVEANNLEFEKELKSIAELISNRVLFVNSAKRKKVHLAAVFANNFTNHLLNRAKNQLESEKISWELLFPLINETVAKALEIGPEKAQTGPAKRNDKITINDHLSLLNETDIEIYKCITNSILIDNNHEKL